jgi:ubiquinone/menaquinone biosynthesis C-methylase UbiE
LQKISDLDIIHKEYRLLSYDGGQMPFENESFDVVLSNAVLNEAENIESLFGEIFRVTKTKGVSHHTWRNYYSFYGSLMPERLALTYPWGHLRGKYVPRKAKLNKLTPTAMRGAFSKYFGIAGMYQIDRNHRKKGVDSSFQFDREEQLLSESIRNELGTFPRELLLTRSYIIVGRKKNQR